MGSPSKDHKLAKRVLEENAKIRKAIQLIGFLINDDLKR
jgi:hypothetical protein